MGYLGFGLDQPFAGSAGISSPSAGCEFMGIASGGNTGSVYDDGSCVPLAVGPGGDEDSAGVEPLSPHPQQQAGGSAGDTSAASGPAPESRSAASAWDHMAAAFGGVGMCRCADCVGSGEDGDGGGGWGRSSGGVGAGSRRLGAAQRKRWMQMQQQQPKQSTPTPHHTSNAGPGVA